MPTSSIFAQVKITDPKKAEAFINALVASANDPPRKPSDPVIPTVTDLDEIRKIVAKRKPRESARDATQCDGRC